MLPRLMTDIMDSEDKRLNTKQVSLNDSIAIRIRPYRNEDSEQVRQLFRAAIVTGADSPLNLAVRAKLKTPLAFASYSISILGLFLVVQSLTVLRRYMGAALFLVGFIPFSIHLFYLRSAFMGFANHAVQSDLADIPTCYGMDRIDGKESNDLSFIGKNGFWVAEALKAEENGRSEIVGCVGIDTNIDFDVEDSAELRRMAVSSKYRRRGIAGQLIKVAVDHARAHGIKSIVLKTPSCNTPALDAYQRFGWVIQKRYVAFKNMEVHFLNLEVVNSIL